MSELLEFATEIAVAAFLTIVFTWLIMQIFFFGTEREPEQRTNSRVFSYSIFIRNLGMISASLAIVFAVVGFYDNDREENFSEQIAWLLLVAGFGISALYFLLEDRTRYELDLYGIERRSWRGHVRIDWKNLEKVQIVSGSSPYVILRTEADLIRVSSYVIGFGEVIYEICYNAPHAEGVEDLIDFFEALAYEAEEDDQS